MSHSTQIFLIYAVLGVICLACVHKKVFAQPAWKFQREKIASNVAYSIPLILTLAAISLLLPIVITAGFLYGYFSKKLP